MIADNLDIKFVCPKCSRPLVIDPRGAGMTIICPDCKTGLIVPERSGMPPEAVSPAPPPPPKEPQIPPPRVTPVRPPKYTRSEEPYDENAISQMISSVLKTYPPPAGFSETAQQIIAVLPEAKSRTERLHLAATLRNESGGHFSKNVRKEMTEVLLHFIRSCLADHRVTRIEQAAVAELRELLGICEADIYGWGKTAIRPLLDAQIDWMQNDYQIDFAEELFLVDLQTIFGLGYDQLRELCEPHVTEILNDLHLQVSLVDRRDVRAQIDQLMRTFCMLRYRPPSFAANHCDAIPARSISQSVKDAVWRRDGGKCAKCGSSHKLEFDHIIPFSLGGSNTYRNIQLLCESCNRSKHARLD